MICNSDGIRRANAIMMKIRRPPQIDHVFDIASNV
jgi:hypothetical protein